MKDGDVVRRTRGVRGGDKCTNSIRGIRMMPSAKRRCGWENIIKMVYKEAAAKIEEEHAEMEKGVFWGRDQFSALINVDKSLTGLGTVSFWRNARYQGFSS